MALNERHLYYLLASAYLNQTPARSPPRTRNNTPPVTVSPLPLDLHPIMPDVIRHDKGEIPCIKCGMIER